MDELVASAVAHWGPRFTMNGVTAGDFDRITSSVESWDDWCATWGAAGAEHEALGREALAEGRLKSAGEHLSQAAVYHHFGKFVFVVDRDQMRAASARTVACATDALPLLDPPGGRVEVPFEDGHLVAVLRVPAGDGPHPVVLMIPGLDSVKEELRTTEQTFLDRGLATFTLDGPGQGESEFDFPIRGDWAPVAEAVWETLAKVPEVDRSRLGVWGVSLGGYYAPRVAAALGDRAKAVVALAGPFDFGDCWDGLPPLTRDTLRVRAGVETDDDARAVAHTLSMTDAAADVVAPLLIVFGRLDRLIPWQHAVRLQEAVSGPVEMLMLENGNHGCANVAPWHRPRTADWLAARLGAADHGLPTIPASESSAAKAAS